MIAGPCSVESEEQTLSTASAVGEAAGATGVSAAARTKPHTAPTPFRDSKRRG